MKDRIHSTRKRNNFALFRTHASANKKPGAMRGSLRKRKKYNNMSQECNYVKCKPERQIFFLTNDKAYRICATRQEKGSTRVATCTRLNRMKSDLTKNFGPNVIVLIGPLGDNKKTPKTPN